MDIREKFVEVFGGVFDFDTVPDWLMAMGPSRFVALVDLTKYHELEFKKFQWIPPPVGYVMLNKTEGYMHWTLTNSFKIMTPNEYAIDLKEVVEEQEDGINKVNALILKDGDHGILIMPRFAIEDGAWDDYDKSELIDCLAETASSVFVI